VVVGDVGAPTLTVKLSTHENAVMLPSGANTKGDQNVKSCPLIPSSADCRVRKRGGGWEDVFERCAHASASDCLACHRSPIHIHCAAPASS